MARPRARPAPPPAAPPSPVPPLALTHPALLLVAAAAVTSLILSVSFQIYEKDFWQHLAVGRAIWMLRSIPTTELWTWPTYGAPDVNPSWGFRALIWPWWSAGGVWGLFAWRWLSTLAVFALAGTPARRWGARGLTPLVVFAVCGLVYRQRSQVRPETLIAVLMALQLWILETRRQGGRDRLMGLIPIALVWANTHLSWHLGLGVVGAHLLGALWDRRRGRPNGIGVRRLAIILLAMVAVSFVNPWGWRALWQPFDYVLNHSHEPIMQSVAELRPVDFANNWRDLLPLLLGGWLCLAVWRARRSGVDLAELLLVGGFVTIAMMTQRFLGFAMVTLAPYLARDLDAWVRTRRWPAWTHGAWARGGLAASACLVLGLAEWARPELPLGVAIDFRQYPARACDFIAAHGVRGHGFNQFYLGGYQLWRFWPERSRLPFMDIHQTGTPEDRYTYAFATGDPLAWHDLDAKYHFDYALIKRVPYEHDGLLDFLDADSSFVPVFLDDAAALYARRDGPMAAVADSFGYRLLPGGTERLGALSARIASDPALAGTLVRELERESAGSEFRSQAEGRLGSIALASREIPAARTHLERALAADPRAARAHERLGLLALAEGNPREAIRELETERRVVGRPPGYEFQLGRAYQTLGDAARAREHYQRELRADPGNSEAADSLRAMDGGTR